MTDQDIKELRAAIDRATVQNFALHGVLHRMVDHLALVAKGAQAEAEALVVAAETAKGEK